MIIGDIIFFIILLAFSAFFSSAETSVLSINKTKLNLMAKKKNKKAITLKKILKDPESFFSTILIGNNFVNISIASLSTVLFTRFLKLNEELVLLIATTVTTIIVLLFGEILPKSYAFRFSETLAYLYVYPIRFFSYMLYPFVRVTAFLSRLLFRSSAPNVEKKDMTTEEIKHFLSTETKLFLFNPDALRMINEIIDIAERDIKSIMTPRLNIVALEESSSIEGLVKLIVDNKLSKIPIYKETLDTITGIIHTEKILPALLTGKLHHMTLKEVASEPIFISEYSSLHYAIKEFKRNRMHIAVILDEYGTTIGILTLNDIFREILGEIRTSDLPVRHIGEKQYYIKGRLPVEEINAQLGISLPEKKDYTTISGLFIYHYGRYPVENAEIRINNIHLIVKKMGKRRIDDLILILE